MMPHLEPIEILDRGQRAQRLLDSPDFTDVMNDLSDYHLAAMVACRPGPREADTRDYHHTLLHALRQVHDELQARSAAAAEIERLMELQEQTEE